MSYTERFSKVISIPYSQTVSYPASEHGGTTTVHGYAEEVVSVNIHVDTTPFDRSIGKCNGHITGLTGAVVATEAAQVESIRKNAARLGRTITQGFFSTVKSDISQQMVELQTRIDADLLHLNELAKKCKEKQLQMHADYQRIASRYSKIFEDLNKELENRIYSLDEYAFKFKNTTNAISERAFDSDMITTVVVSGNENSSLEARISASLAKKRALDSISQANEFLAKQKRTEMVLARSSVSTPGDGTYYSPVCYMETEQEGVINRNIHASKLVAKVDNKTLMEQAKRVTQHSDNVKAIQHHFNQELNSKYSAGDKHSDRVYDCIARLFNNSIKTL